MQVYPIVPLCISLIWFVGIVLFYTTSGYSWAGWQRATGYPHIYCEQASGKPLEQFSNSFSNLGYMLVGLLILFRPLMERRNAFCTHALYPLTMGGSLLAIGWGSLFYHGSLTEMGRFCDWMGMYLFASFFVLYSLVRFAKLGTLCFALLYMPTNVALALAIVYVNPFWRSPIFGLLLACGVTITVFANYRWQSEAKTRYLLVALLVLFAALVLWDLDRTGVLCDPTSVFQGHAAWQAMTAIAAGLLYLYICSEYTPVEVSELIATEQPLVPYVSSSSEGEEEDIFDHQETFDREIVESNSSSGGGVLEEMD